MKFKMSQASGKTGKVINHSDRPDPVLKGLWNVWKKPCSDFSKPSAKGTNTTQIGNTQPGVLSLTDLLLRRTFREMPILHFQIKGMLMKR
ncbi:MAG: hypothetical protein R2825_10075 [Saprospiraceae bacterium]